MLRSSPQAALCLAALAGFAVFAAGCGADSEGVDDKVTGGIAAKASALFVIRGDARAEDGRVFFEADTVEWFADRPVRLAGVSETAELAGRWAEFGFGKDPPNAALAGGDAQAVVELTDPRLEDGEISFAYEPIGPAPPEGELGELSVFIDDASQPSPCATQLTISNGDGSRDLWTFSSYAFSEGGTAPSATTTLSTTRDGETYEVTTTVGDSTSGQPPDCSEQSQLIQDSFTGTSFRSPSGELAGQTWTCTGTVGDGSARGSCDGSAESDLEATGSLADTVSPSG